MRTDRLDLFGLALLTASLGLFSAASVVRDVAAGPARPAIDTHTAATVDIAIRARAEGRAAHADSLLASLAARYAAASAAESGPRDVSALINVATACFPALAMSLGIAGMACVVKAGSRRRRAFELLSDELGQTTPDDDQGRLFAAVYRLRIERATAQSQLQKAQALLEQELRAGRSAAANCAHPSALEARLPGPDSNPHPLHELGRIIEITSIDPDCDHDKDHSQALQGRRTVGPV